MSLAAMSAAEIGKEVVKNEASIWFQALLPQHYQRL